MSFSTQLKQEIIRNKPMRVRYRKAQAYGLFLFGRAFTPEEVSLHSANEEVAELFGQFARDMLGRGTQLQWGQLHRSGKTVHTVCLPEAEDRRRLLDCFAHSGGIVREIFPTADALGAFLAGAYLACGNMTDPEKSYHLEFVVHDQALCTAFAALLDEVIPGARTSRRRHHCITYYKEFAPIEDLLTMMGATKSCLAVIDVETIKSVRNQANRATNCETANIDKLVGAATAQIEDIQLLLRVKGEDALSASLLAAAKLRLENPEASLRELTALADGKISRSGMYHRLDKLSQMAAELRNQRGGQGIDE